ncbi:MAG: cytochrome o ubiquinol oxidase subunit IV [Pseudolabrys sp.]|jgi:cytochrome o ubiquinol oxidase operon protein cyoD
MRSLIDTHDPRLRVYLTGFVLALALTILPFSLVVFKVLPETWALAVVGGLAVVQMGVHLHYFLHLNLSASERSNLLSLAFAAVIIFMMAGGTMWIMFNLHYRMMA